MNIQHLSQSVRQVYNFDSRWVGHRPWIWYKIGTVYLDSPLRPLVVREPQTDLPTCAPKNS